MRLAHLAEGVEYVIKIDENLALGNLGDIIHSFTGIVPHPRILVREASKHGGHDYFQILGQLLETSKGAVSNCAPSCREAVDLPSQVRWRQRPGQ